MMLKTFHSWGWQGGKINIKIIAPMLLQGLTDIEYIWYAFEVSAHKYKLSLITQEEKMDPQGYCCILLLITSNMSKGILDIVVFVFS